MVNLVALRGGVRQSYVHGTFLSRRLSLSRLRLHLLPRLRGLLVAALTILATTSPASAAPSSKAVLVKDIRVGSANDPSAAELTNVGGILFFLADDGTSGFELWRSNGTAAGTVLVRDINPDSANSSLGGLTEVDGTLFFAADDGANGRELWKTKPPLH